MFKFSKNILSVEKVSFLLLFLFNSFAGWIALSFQILHNSTKRQKNVVFWSVLTIILVSLYNSTKIPENDLAWYASFYLMADKYDLVDYLAQLTGGKEPLYQMLVYFLHYIGGDNVHVFVFSVSILSYSFLLKALIIWKKELNLSDIDYMLAVMTLCFFPWTFALSAHIIRQFLALSIMLWAFFSYHSTYKKRYLFFALCSLFIHSSVVLFIPFLFIKKICRAIKLKYLYIVFGIIALFSSIKQLGAFAQHYVKNSKTLAHIAQKAVDGTYFETSLPLSQFLFSVALVFFGFTVVYVINSHLKEKKIITLFLNISLILLFFIMASSNYSEIQLRYNFYFWSFIPFFIIIYIMGIKLKSYSKISFMFILFLFWNVYNILWSQWTYTCANYYFLYPAFWYFLD